MDLLEGVEEPGYYQCVPAGDSLLLIVTFTLKRDTAKASSNNSQLLIRSRWVGHFLSLYIADLQVSVL